MAFNYVSPPKVQTSENKADAGKCCDELKTVKQTLDVMQKTIDTLRSQSQISASGTQQLNNLSSQVLTLQKQISESGQGDNIQSTAVSASVYAIVYAITAAIIGYLIARWT